MDMKRKNHASFILYQLPLVDATYVFVSLTQDMPLYMCIEQVQQL